MAVIGEAVYKISYDPNTQELKSALRNTETKLGNTGTSSGKAFGLAWSAAAGSLIAKGVAKIASTISSNLGDAIKRVDVINNFPKVMSNLGIGAGEAQASITKLSEKLRGLPTSLQDGASAVQRFTSKNGDVAKSTDLFLALNNAILAGGGSAEIQSTALEQLSQSYAKGKPDMMEWRSAMTAMPAQLNQVAQAMGFGENAADALGEALRNGDVSMDDFMSTIVKLNTDGSNGFQSFEKQAKNSTGGIGTTLENLKNRTVAAIGEVINTIGAENIAGMIEGLSGAITGIGTAIAGVVNWTISNWSIIEPILTGVLTFVGALLAMGIGQKIITFLTTTATLVAAHPVLAIISLVAAGATLIIQNWEGISAFFGETFEGIGNIVSGAWNGIVSGAQSAWNFITGLFGKLASFFGSIFSNAWNAVKRVFSTGGQIFSGIVQGIFNVFRNVVNGIINGINMVVARPFNAINGALNRLRGINIAGMSPFGWLPSIAVPQIPRLATGGIVPSQNGGHVILAGEAGQDEWVVPESKMASLIEQMNARGAGGNITVNVYGTFATSTSEQRKVAEVIAQRIQEIQKSRLNAGGTL
jgi:tape measure domain-containing protein